jgi:hypothetical protein
MSESAIGNGTIGPQSDSAGSITVTPVLGTLASGEAGKAALVAYQNAVPDPFVFPPLVDANGNPISIGAAELIVFDQSNANAQKFTIPCAVSGAGSNIVTATATTQMPAAGNFSFDVWDAPNKKVRWAGSFTIRATAGP